MYDQDLYNPEDPEQIMNHYRNKRKSGNGSGDPGEPSPVMTRGVQPRKSISFSETQPHEYKTDNNPDFTLQNEIVNNIAHRNAQKTKGSNISFDHTKMQMSR